MSPTTHSPMCAHDGFNVSAFNCGLVGANRGFDLVNRGSISDAHVNPS